MKKLILSLFLVSILFLVGCNKKEPVNKNESEVKLLSLTSYESQEVKTRKKTAFRLVEDETESKIETNDYQFVVLMNNNTYLDLVIKLDNPNDYHIFDFTLECDDTNAKVLVNEEYKLLTDLKSINWRGDTNSQYTIKMQISSQEFINSINLTSMYYSDRATGENKYNVDLNNKGQIDVYRLYDGVNVKLVNYNTYKIEIADEHIVENSIKINNTDYDITKEIVIDSEELIITYNYQLNDNTIKEGKTTYKRPNLISYGTGLYQGVSLLNIQLQKEYLTCEIEIEIYNASDNSLIQDYVFKNNEFILEIPHIEGTTYYFMINKQHKINW